MALDNKKDWLKEFTDFSNANSQQVPSLIFNELKRRLFPNPWVVFGKVTAIHFVVGLLSLAICNQFGLNPFHTNQSLTNWFMKLGGHHVCMFLCGTFFMATTYLLANFFLSLEELEAVRRHEWLQTSVIGLISLAAFYFFGAEMVMAFVALWIAGAFLGGLLSIEGSYRLRRGWVRV
jgi:hypothetical protein